MADQDKNNAVLGRMFGTKMKKETTMQPRIPMQPDPIGKANAKVRTYKPPDMGASAGAGMGAKAAGEARKPMKSPDLLNRFDQGLEDYRKRDPMRSGTGSGGNAITTKRRKYTYPGTGKPRPKTGE